jgi:alpha-D-xyloside xylohydrolase
MIDEESVDVVRDFARLKCRLMPYLFRAAVDASQSGVPVMRAMLLEFPEDPTAAFLDRQYMLGESLLVAPVFAEDGQVTYYVPAGRWTHLTSGAKVMGPRWITEHHDSSTLPLLVRPGSVIAMGARSDRADYDFADGVTLRAYELAEGAKVAVAVPDMQGGADSRFEVTRSAAVVVAERSRGSKPWYLMLANSKAATAVTGGTVENTPEGLLVTAASGSDRVEVTLAG